MIAFNNAVLNLSNDGRRQLAATFRLERGDFAVLLGLNGAGKTTLLDAIVGIRPVKSGKIEITPADWPIAYVVQDSASGLLPWKTILDNILFPAVMHRKAGADVAKRASSLLDEFKLADRRNDFPYRLSEGEKQIVNVIRCVCTPADVILLDEPFSALNSHAKVKVKRLLAEFSKERITVLVTHDPADCDLPLNRFFLISNSTVQEVKPEKAKEFLSNDLSKA